MKHWAVVQGMPVEDPLEHYPTHRVTTQPGWRILLLMQCFEEGVLYISASMFRDSARMKKSPGDFDTERNQTFGSGDANEMPNRAQLEVHSNP